MKQTEYFGRGSIKKLANLVSAKKVFIVTGKKSFENSGAQAQTEKILATCDHDFFSDFAPNPQLADIQKGYQRFIKFNPNLIVAIGGGSSIDVAKALKLLHFQSVKKKVPLIAIPTTAGSGSEATWFSVYYKGKDKQSGGAKEITLPDYAIIDPDLISSLPWEIAAASCMDALSQAVESYWSINSNTDSKNFAREAMRLIMENFAEYRRLRSPKSRSNMMKAANLAGKAINITKTTVCHALSYPLTVYFQIPHGHAVALTLGAIAKFNFHTTKKNCLDKRGACYVQKTLTEIATALSATNPDQIPEKVAELMRKAALETRLSKLGIKRNAFKKIIKKALSSGRASNNPRKITPKSLHKILEEVF